MAVGGNIMNNPFSITFGMEPNNYIKRIQETNKIIENFNSETPSSYVYLITGVRGSGKTVFLSNIASILNKDDRWIVADSGQKSNILENIASDIYENGKVKHLFVKKEFNFSFNGISFSLKGKEPVSSVMGVLKKMLEHIKSKGKRVLITIDEVDNSQNMKEFVQAYQSLIRLHYPVMLLMTGLYENVSKLQDDSSITFLYRAPKIHLGPLSLSTIASRYREYLGVDEQTSIKLSKMTNGYAYAYQVLGFLLSESGKNDIDQSILSEYDQTLAECVYDKAFSELSPKEKEVLMAMNNDGETEIKDIKEATSIDQKALSVYRDRLIKRGILISNSYGKIEFALPRFNEFLKYKF